MHLNMLVKELQKREKKKKNPKERKRGKNSQDINQN